MVTLLSELELSLQKGLLQGRGSLVQGGNVALAAMAREAKVLGDELEANGSFLAP